MASTNWILTANGTWHAWKVGESATACGRIDAAHLRRSPAQLITRDVPIDQKTCAACIRRTKAIPFTTDAVTSAWIQTVRRHLEKVHAKLPDKTVLILAERLAEVGPPTNPEAGEIFEQVKQIFLRPMRTTMKLFNGSNRTLSTFPHLKEALALLPTNTQAIRRVASAVRCWSSFGLITPSTRFRLDHVIQAILDIPSIEPYVQHQRSRGLLEFALIFHPNTLARARKDTALRGLFSGSTEYWQATTDQLNIVN